MHFQFLIKDQSGSVVIKEMMSRMILDSSVDTYDCKSFKGIGGFTKKNTVKEMHTGKLLNDLATYMRGFQRRLQGIDAVLIIVMDNDNRNPKTFKEELELVSNKNCINMDHVFCLAVEEIEAWLLGDKDAIQKAYPKMKATVFHSYVQDSICGTWEVLANVVYNGGIKEIRKRKMSYMEIGKLKSEWALNIGKNMNFEMNRSPSFQFFYKEIQNRLSPKRVKDDIN